MSKTAKLSIPNRKYSKIKMTQSLDLKKKNTIN